MLVDGPNGKRLVPDDTKRDALYILAQETANCLNLVTWAWWPIGQVWHSLSGGAFSPETLARTNWVIFEETKEDVFLVKDYFGRIVYRR